jgi:pimeloyl-ACP methyl ester carboxylesterase
VGSWPFDLVYVPGFVSHVELRWTVSSFASHVEELATFARLILFDKRGTGMSDRVGGAPTLETRMDDLRAVMDAAGSERAAVFGVSEGAPMSLMFAATYPERTAALCLRRQLARFRGREVDTAGDGLFASFDGPARAIRCACAITDSVREVGLEIRAGVHTGECEVIDGKVAGITVHTGARVAGLANAGEVLVSGDRQGSCRGLRVELRGPRRAPAQGHPRRVATVRRRAQRLTCRAGPGPIGHGATLDRCEPARADG